MGRGRKSGVQKLPEKGEPSSSLLPPTPESEQEVESVNKVFSIPLLLDEIIKYSIHKADGIKLDPNCIASLRRVNTNWLQATSRVLKQDSRPAIRIEIGCQLTKLANLNSNPYRKRKNILDNCASVLSQASPDSILPIYLSIGQTYFIKENEERLYNFLEQCNNMIYYVNINFPSDGGSMTLKSGSLTLPVLEQLRFVFETGRLQPKYKSKSPVLGNNSNGFTLLQEIIQKCNALQELYLENAEDTINISTLSLPKSLKDLLLRSSITSNEWTLLTQNQLPNLKILRLNIIKLSEEYPVSKILEYFQHQLTAIDINYTAGENDPRLVIKFPLLKMLKDFNLHGRDCDVFPNQRNTLPKFIPNLAKLKFSYIQQSFFLDWVGDLQFQNVKDVDILETSNTNKYQIVSPNVQTVMAIKASFPKIEKLTLIFKLNETSGLKHLFRNISQLKQLHLEVAPEKTDRSPGFEMISVFLGVSLEVAKALVDRPEENLDIPMDHPESIMNMKELEFLNLSVLLMNEEDRGVDIFGLKIISKYGFERMPNLRRLKLLEA